MLSNVNSATCLGIKAVPVSIEVDVIPGKLPKFTIVGLPDTAIKEARDRVKTAINNSGYSMGSKNITVNLAPCDIKKEGTSFDFPIAVGILTSLGYIKQDRLKNYIFLGELALDGALRSIPGTLSIASSLAHSNQSLILPKESAKEASLEQRTTVYEAPNLKEVVRFLNQESTLENINTNIQDHLMKPSSSDLDFQEVKGQSLAKRALEIAVSGFHHVLMIGPPGSGKSMLAKRVSSIFPDMETQEILDIMQIYSISNTPKSFPISRPYRSPHSSTSQAGLIGGGTIPKPGEVSLAHHGILFLDEFPEFRRDALEALRSPLEDQKIMISRARHSLTFPANFMLICAMNPCPCGNLGLERKNCFCTISQINQYRNKISGPLMDRIDIHMDIPAVTYHELSINTPAESSASIRQRVQEARRIQKHRFKDSTLTYNSQIPDKHLEKFCSMEPQAKTLLKDALTQLGISARAYSRIIKVARTIADLESCEIIQKGHIAEAIQYRSLDRN